MDQDSTHNGRSAWKSAVLRWGKLALIFFVGFAVGFPIDGPYWMKRLFHADPLRESRLGKTKFINPLLECDLSDKKEAREFKPLESEIITLIDQKARQHETEKVGFYFRMMDTGRWVGLNEYAKFSAASLMKIPFMLAYFKLAEVKPEVLRDRITFDGNTENTDSQTIQPSHTIEGGKTYSVEELIYRMIVYSGNNSTVLLVKHLDPHFIDEVFSDLNIPLERSAEKDALISAIQYSFFFRVLYNASYLNRVMSEKALELLSQTEFKDGLVAGVPSDVIVAHKFGERSFVDSAGKVTQNELHDCGIVYHSKHPYFLCVMTSGSDFSQLKKTIQDISRTVYSFVDSNRYQVND